MKESRHKFQSCGLPLPQVWCLLVPLNSFCFSPHFPYFGSMGLVMQAHTRNLISFPLLEFFSSGKNITHFTGVLIAVRNYMFFKNTFIVLYNQDISTEGRGLFSS